MFDDSLGMAMQCTEHFRDGVRDSFGLSIMTDVLEPMLRDIESLREFNERYNRQASAIDRALHEARAIQFQGHGFR